MKITNAKYQTSISSDKNVSIGVTIDGETMSVPLDPDNRHYEEILRQVEAGDLTIADAD